MKVLVTGAAGFIGSHVSLYLLERGDEVVGLDNINDYYDVNLKLSRLERVKQHKNAANFSFSRAFIAVFMSAFILSVKFIF